jgi:hypothetical protein
LLRTGDFGDSSKVTAHLGPLRASRDSMLEETVRGRLARSGGIGIG